MQLRNLEINYPIPKSSPRSLRLRGGEVVSNQCIGVGSMAERALSNASWLRFAEIMNAKTKMPRGVPIISPMTRPAQNMESPFW